MNIRVYSPSEFREERMREREYGVERGALLGFKNFRDSFSIKLGSTLYLYGAPNSGKTTLKYEILRQLTEYYGWSHMIIDPETGLLGSVSSKIVKVIAGKDLGNNNDNQMSLSEQITAEQIADKHFHLINSFGEEKLKIDEIFQAHTDQEVKLGRKIHTISIDPWNYISHDVLKAGGWAMYLEEILPYIYSVALKKDIYVIIVHHVRDQAERKIRVGKVDYHYYPPPNPRDLGGGQSWYRYGMSMVCCWIPPEWWVDENGYPKIPFETHIYFQKKKPDGVAEEDDLTDYAKLYWVPKYKRYYELIGSAERYPESPQQRAVSIKKKDLNLYQSYGQEDDLPF